MASSKGSTAIQVPPRAARSPAPSGASGAVSSIGAGVHIVGQVTASEHLIIEGTIDGEVVLPDHGVAIGGRGRVDGEVSAHTITVLGKVDGRLTASALIELRPSAQVTGRLSSPHLSMEEGARFKGISDPTRAEAAMAVARHRQAPVPERPTDAAEAMGSDPADT